MELTVQGGTRFTDLDSRLGAEFSNHFYFRADWVDNVLIEAAPHGGHYIWEAQHEATAEGLEAGERDVRSNRFLVLHRRGESGRAEVVCRRGSETARVVVWFVSATLRLNTAGPPSTSLNAFWPDDRAYMINRYSFPVTYTPDLGVHAYDYSDSSGIGARYMAFVEAIGEIRPATIAATRLRFYVARRFVTAPSVTGVDAGGRPLDDTRGPAAPVNMAGDDDSNRNRDQSSYSRPLTGRGQLFDYDMAGSSFVHPDSVAGDTHRWRVSWELVIGVGSVPSGSIWNVTMAEHRDIGRIVRLDLRVDAVLSAWGRRNPVQLTGRLFAH